MTAQTVVVQGTLQADGKLDLRGPVALPPGPVEVTVRALRSAGDQDLLTLLARIRAEQQASGHKPRTKEEIDSDVQQMRDEWPERVPEIEEHQAKVRHKPGAAGAEPTP